MPETRGAPPDTETGSAGRPQTGWRARLRRTPGGAPLLQGLVFVVGLLFILLGIGLAALPGPLTIPPILVGLYIWSTEFAWAERLLDRAKKSAREAWEKSRAKPVISALVTISGLVALGVGIYLAGRLDLVARGRDLVGL
jgi:hypothetical protein